MLKLRSRKGPVPRRPASRSPRLCALHKGTLALALLGAGSCNDLATGQLPEPSGPIQIIKVTLLDEGSRDGVVFTDMSLPDCKTAPDCTTPENKDTFVCAVCYISVAKDRYSQWKSPPTPDSGQDIRVVFNKLPLLLDGSDITRNPNDPGPVQVADSAIALQRCASPGSCTPVGGFNKYLISTGGDISFDPTTIPYGPALQLQADLSDPRRSLEPGTTYQIVVSPGVSGRDGEKVDLAAAAKLLSFTTEPFRALSVGTGGGDDTFVYKDETAGQGTSASPYKVADLPLDGAIVLAWNASLDPAALAAIKPVAMVNGGPTTVKFLVGTDVSVTSGGKCAKGGQRHLYLYPDTMNGTWQEDPMKPVNELTLTIPANTIGDLSQDDLSKPGTHKLGGDLVITAKLTGKPGGTGYAGTTVGKAKAATQACMP